MMIIYNNYYDDDGRMEEVRSVLAESLKAFSHAFDMRCDAQDPSSWP